MQKIISVFQRNYDGDRLIRDEVVPGAEWVLAGEGVATRKWDGTCCLIRGGKLYKRYDAKWTVHESGAMSSAGQKPLPPGFEEAQPPDSVTGHWPGWVPVGNGPNDRWHREAVVLADWPSALKGGVPVAESPDGTYELIGPKVQGNPEDFGLHVLLPHGKHPLEDCPRTFAALRDWLAGCDIEGVVFHHPDGRMAKVKKKDFGLQRRAKS